MIRAFLCAIMKKLHLLILFVVGLSSNLYSQQSTTTYDSLSVELAKIKAKSEISKTDRNILNLLNKLHDENLQSDNGGISKETLKEYESYKTNKVLRNWHIFYLFDTYQNEVTNTELNGHKNNRSLRLAIMKLLSGELIQLYGDIPPIVLVYMGEALMNADYNDKARNHFEMSLQFYPQSVPLKVYNWVLTNNQSQKNKLYKDLTKKHKDHWMVKQFLSNP